MNLDATFLPIGAEAPLQREHTLRMAAIEERSFVAGPGARAVVWVAGCLRRCPGCMKPDLFSFDAGEDIGVATLADRINAVPEIAGVTFSGGEPFEQSKALANLARRVKLSGLNVAAYTGYRLEYLQDHPHQFGDLLTEVDILIDGEYRHDLPGPFILRGSSNQRVHDFRRLLPASPVPVQPVREIQLTVRNNQLRLSGFPSQEMERALTASLQKKGIILKSI